MLAEMPSRSATKAVAFRDFREDPHVVEAVHWAFNH
jgi:hypothetical protein